MICSVDDCERETTARGWCPLHYKRWLKHGTTDAPSRTAWNKYNGPCIVDGCDRPPVGKKMCNRHKIRVQKHGDPLVVLGRGPGDAEGWIDTDGYRKRYVPGRGRQREHRLVMEQILGRQLEPNENVHHINGDRADNRPENLELWVKSQPSGQRIDDLIDYVAEFHADAILAAISRKRRGRVA